MVGTVHAAREQGLCRGVLAAPGARGDAEARPQGDEKNRRPDDPGDPAAHREAGDAGDRP